jgi:hypothetical protein
MENNYNLQKFLGIGSRVGNYFISFNKSGFMISSGFYAKENIKDSSRVVLYFDPEKKAVGFEFTNDNSAEGSFTLVHGNKGTTGSISVRSFVIAHNLNQAEYFGRKIPKKIDHQGSKIFVIDLVDKEKQNQDINENGKNI